MGPQDNAPRDNQGPLRPSWQQYVDTQATQGYQKDLQAPDLKGAVEQGGGNFLRSMDTMFRSAREGTYNMMVPPTVPEDATIRKVLNDPILGALNPIPGSLPQAVGMGAMAIPGAGPGAMMLRPVTAGALTGATAGGIGDPDWLEQGLQALYGQLAGELAFKGGRTVQEQRQGAKTFAREEQGFKDYEAKDKQYRADMDAFKTAEAQRKAAFKGSENARVLTEQTQQAALTAAHNEAQAAKVAGVVKSQVPTWAKLGNTAKDLWDMAFGKSWSAVQDMYDASLKEVIERGRGQKVPVPTEAADALGVDYQSAKSGRQDVKKGDLALAWVDAGELAEKMTGKSKTAFKAYQRAAAALDEANIGDPKARQEYRNASMHRAFADKSQYLENQEFHPERVQSGLGKTRVSGNMPHKNVDLYTVLEESKPRPASPLTPKQPFVPGTPPARPSAPPAPTVERGTAGKAGAVLGGVTGLGIGELAGKTVGHPWLGGAMGAKMGAGAGAGIGSQVPWYSGPGTRVPQPGLGGRAGRAVVGSQAQKAAKEAWDYITSDDVEAAQKP